MLNLLSVRNIGGNFCGYNLGTSAPKPHKQGTKSYQNDAISTRKTMKFMIYIEPKKEFE